MAGITNAPGTGGEQGVRDDRLLRELHREVAGEARRLQSPITLDLYFLAFLRRVSRFGFFTFGPITIDVRLIEDLVERTVPSGDVGVWSDGMVRMSQLVMQEVRRSGRRRIDELHLLLAFMKVGEGLPERVFSELGVTPAQVEAYARSRRTGTYVPEKLYSPEEAAEYLGVHVQTVRAWIRSGRLPASRLAGRRALRIKASDLESVLEPVEPADEPEDGPR